MSAQPVHSIETADTSSLIHRLHGLVTRGPWDLDIVAAMRPLGYNEVRWAEGECFLAQLVAADPPDTTTVAAAATWFDEAARNARTALGSAPFLLARLGLGTAGDARCVQPADVAPLLFPREPAPVFDLDCARSPDCAPAAAAA